MIRTVIDANRVTNRALCVRANDSLDHLIAQISEAGVMHSIDFAGHNLLREANRKQTLHDIGIGPGGILDVSPEELFIGGEHSYESTRLMRLSSSYYL